MCELSKSEYEQDCKPLPPMPSLDAVFAPHVARAEALADKIHRAARLCREGDDDTRREELAAWKAARAENDGAQP